MPVSMTQSGSTYYLAYDQVGSLRAVMGSNGTIVKQVDYDSFGSIISDNNTAVTVPFGFAGGLHDRDTGLVRFGARDYDPAIGKWTAKDPIDFAGGDVNLFGYVANNPIRYKDPLGLGPIEDGREHLNIIAQQLMNRGYTAEQIVNMMKGLSGSLEYDPAQATTMSAVVLSVLGNAALVGGAAVGGYVVGSLINDIPVAGTNLTTSEWWANYIWQLTHNNNNACSR
jgi:RHS repeat-associated protein